MNDFRIFFPILLSLLILPMTCLPQGRHCGTEAYSKYIEQHAPALKQLRLEAARVLKNRKTTSRMAEADNSKIYRIPVVVHVLWNTEASNISEQVILSQIKILNEDYRRKNADTSETFDIFKPVAGDAGFEFFLASIDPSGNPSNGIVRKFTSTTHFSPSSALLSELAQLSYWPSDQYLNIWVTTITSGYIGLGPIPEDIYANVVHDVTADGVAIHYKAFGINSFDYNLGRTTTHEVGHWLGLIHLWGSDGTCESDFVDDTPLQRTNNEDVNDFCLPQYSDCNNISTQDMSNNYMDYSPDACMNIFTKGQAKRMRESMEYNRLRLAIQHSPALQGPTAVFSNQDAGVPGLYPNPSHDFVSVSLKSKGITTIDLLFYNSIGQEVLKVRDYVPGNDATVDLTSLPAGIYYVKAMTGNQSGKLSRLVKL